MKRTPFRELIQRFAPPTLRGFVGSRFLYSIGLQIDALGDLAWEGIRNRFPEEALKVGNTDAIGLIGRDRRIYRGPDEPYDVYVGRLLRWIDDWRMAGSAFSVLAQVQAYLTPNAQRLRLVNNAGCWYTLEPDGTRTYQRSAPANWDWDTHTEWWSRFWLIIYCDAHYPFAVGPNWGDPGFVYDPTKTWGTTATPAHVASIRAIVQDWKSAHSKCQNIIIAFDPASFDPKSSPGAPMPDGTWGHWSNSSVPSGRSRLATARYWKGSA